MDFNIASFGVNLGIVLGIIFLSQMIKMILSKTKIENKIKKYYVLLPLVLSILGALASTTPLTIQKYFPIQLIRSLE